MRVLLVREAEPCATREGAALAAPACSATARAALRRTSATTSRPIAAIATRRRACVRVTGRLRGGDGRGAELELRSLQAAPPGSFDEAGLRDGPLRSAALMEADLRELVGTIQDRDLRRLLDAVLGPRAAAWPHFRTAPAAKRFHQAYRHGLLEHSLSVAQAVSAISATFGGIDRDVAVTGALLHDIGKLDAYAFAGSAIEMTGRRQAAGRDPARLLPGAAAHRDASTASTRARRRRVLHIILSHHGSLEYGSPGAAVHARGDARALLRQPRRAPRVLRPARARAAVGRALVALRSRDRRRRLLRRRGHAAGARSGLTASRSDSPPDGGEARLLGVWARMPGLSSSVPSLAETV